MDEKEIPVMKKLFQNKSVRSIIIALLSLGILGIIYAVVINLDTNTNTAKKTPVDNSIIITDHATSDIVKIENKASDFFISKTEEGFSLNGTADENVSPVAIYSYVSSLSRLYAVREIKKFDDIKEFGLDNSNKKIIITLKDNKKITCILGDMTPAKGEYYFMIEGEDKIYTVEETTATLFSKTTNEFMDKFIATLDPTKITAMEIKKGDKTVLSFTTNEASDSFEDTLSGFKMTYPYDSILYSSAFDTFLPSFAVSVQAIEYIEKNVSNTEKYGFGSGYELTITQGDEKIRLLYGDKVENAVYTMIEGKNDVFTTDLTLYNLISTVKPFDLISKYVSLYNIENISLVEIQGQGKSHKLQIDRKKDKYSINGKSVDWDTIRPIYQVIIGVTAVSEAVTEKIGETVLTVTFTGKDNKKETVTYKEYDDRNYSVIKSSNAIPFTVLRKNVDAILSELSKY